MNPIEMLTDARSREVPWPLIVKAVGELTKSGSIDDRGRPLIEVAAHLTGYTTNQLRIGQRTFSLIRSFIDAHNLPTHALEWPMSSLEVITRISKANEERAKQILISRKIHTLRELRNYYDQVRSEAGNKISAMSAGHQSAKRFAQSLYKDLSHTETLQRILGLQKNTAIGSLKIWPGRYPYVHPDFHVEFLIDGKLQLVAFEGLRFYGDVTSQVATKAALKAAVEATFFSRYYWCTPSWVSIDDLVMLREKLGLLNVGILSVGETKVEAIVDILGPSIHDRQAVLLNDAGIRSRLGISL